MKALGMVETRGLVCVVEALDAMLKTADVSYAGQKRVGSGLIAVLVEGDVAAVTAAIDTGQQSVAALGNLIAAHVIARPSAAVLDLLPAFTGS